MRSCSGLRTIHCSLKSYVMFVMSGQCNVVEATLAEETWILHWGWCLIWPCRPSGLARGVFIFFCGQDCETAWCLSAKSTIPTFSSTTTLELAKIVKQRDVCQQNQPSPPSAPLQPWSWPTRPWSCLHIEYAGPFEKEKWYYVVIDAHLKRIKAIATLTATTQTTIQQLWRKKFHSCITRCYCLR